MSSFQVRGLLQARIHKAQIRTACLSCPDQDQKAKPLLGTTHIQTGRYDARQHIEHMLALGKLSSRKNALLVCGVRNVMANHRCIVYTAYDGLLNRRPPYAVAGETPLRRIRPYFIMGMTNDSEWRLEEYHAGANLHRFQWLFSGVPVLWDDLTSDELFERMITEVADPSHIYHLPRGNHPEASDQTRRIWQQLHDAFRRGIHETRQVANSYLYPIVQNHKLVREDSYFHHLMALDDDNNLVLQIGHGVLEELGKQMRRECGARRALCVENGGSVTLLFYPYGVDGVEITLTAAPNHRRQGTAVLILELEDHEFSPWRMS